VGHRRNRMLISATTLACFLSAPGIGLSDDVEPLPSFEYGVRLDSDSEPVVDRVVLDKSERRLVLMNGDLTLFEYEVALGSSPKGPKRRQGDGRTPEGRYIIDWRKPNSDYYRALHISYPNKADMREARRLGVEPGGAIMIHGLPNGFGMIGTAHRVVDWTDGCVAVTNDEMDEIWERVRDGVPIEIRP